MKTYKLQVRLDEDLRQRLQIAAKMRGTNISKIIEKSIIRSLDEAPAKEKIVETIETLNKLHGYIPDELQKEITSIIVKLKEYCNTL